MLLKIILLAFIFSKALAFLEELPSKQEIEAEWEFEFDCTDKPSRSMHAIGCSPFYWWCYRGTGERISCEDNKFFNPEIDECDLRENVAACNAVSNPVEVASAKVLDEETTPSTSAVDCSNLPDGDYLDPSQTCSNTYITCSNQVRFVRLCPGDLFFNKDIGLCDVRQNVPACNTPLDPVEPVETAAIMESAPIHPPEAVVTSEQADGFVCSTLPDGNYADPMHPSQTLSSHAITKCFIFANAPRSVCITTKPAMHVSEKRKCQHALKNRKCLLHLHDHQISSKSKKRLQPRALRINAHRMTSKMHHQLR